MPYYHMSGYDHLIKRKCTCGGDAEVIMDFVQDFEVRCSKCHLSTHAHMEPEEAIRHWNAADDFCGTMDLLIDDLDKNLQGEILEIRISDDMYQYNNQSCDVSEAMLVYKDKFIRISHEEADDIGAIGFERWTAFNPRMYRYVVKPKTGKPIQFIKIFYEDDGSIAGLKMRIDDRYLFVFVSEHDLIITKSSFDLLEEDEDTHIPYYDDSVLFE